MTQHGYRTTMFITLCLCLTSIQALAFQTAHYTYVTYENDQTIRDQKIADVDNDGIEDIITIDQSYYSVTLVTASSMTRTAYALPSGVGGLSVAVGDLDGDGYNDIIVGTQNGANVHDRVYINDGDGTFTFSTTLYKTDDDHSRKMEVADLDDDGDLDVIVSYEDIYDTNHTTQRWLRTHLNDGSGAFSLEEDGFALLDATSGNAEYYQISLGDMDNDGYPDLMVTSRDNRDASFLGDGDGTFTLEDNQGASRNTASHTLGDLDGDGYLDLVLCGYGGTSTTTDIRYGNGDGTFDTPSAIFSPTRHFRVEIADINNDTRADLVLSGEVYVEHAFQNSSGGFDLQTQQLPFGTARVGTFDSDGRIDLMWTAYGTPFVHKLYKNTNPDADHISIPDANFKSFLLSNYDTNSDGGISVTEAATASGIMDCSSSSIANLTGLEYFTGVYAVKAQNNSITTVPALDSSSLLTLWLFNNDLTSLPSLADVENLTSLDVSGNDLTSLPSLTANVDLIELYCQNNDLTSLPAINHLEELRYFNASDNSLTSLPNLDDLAEMRIFRVGGNSLTSIPSLADMAEIQKLYIDRNSLTAMPSLSGLTTLTHIYAGVNSLTSAASLSGLTALSVLDLKANSLTALPSLTDQGDLTYLDAHDNGLTSLPSMTHMTDLVTLYLQENSLTAVPDVSSNTSLATFWIHYNDLDSGDCTEITDIIDAGDVTSFVYNPANGGTITCP